MSNFNLVILNAAPVSVLVRFGHLSVVECSAADAAELYNKAAARQSYVGHADTAALMSGILGEAGAIAPRFPDGVAKEVVPMHRGNYAPQRTQPDNSGKGEKHDVLLLGVYNGPRLPEGTSRLPEGATLSWAVIADLHVRDGRDYAMNALSQVHPREDGHGFWSGDIY